MFETRGYTVEKILTNSPYMKKNWIEISLNVSPILKVCMMLQIIHYKTKTFPKVSIPFLKLFTNV